MFWLLVGRVKQEVPLDSRSKIVGMHFGDSASGLTTDSEHRRRLLQGMARVAASKGFAATTIADVVREAGVSKRTFYEHFDGKESCFLALYQAVSGSALKVLRDVVTPDRPWRFQLDHAMRTYLSHLAASPELLRTLFIEIHHLGSAGERARREVMTALASLMTDTLRRDTGEPAIPEALALAAVGGINELVLQAIEQGRVDRLAELTDTASDLVRRLAGAPQA